MIKKSNHRISLTFEEDLYKCFQHNYPNCLSQFLRNAILYACSNKKLFQDIYFKDFKIEEYR